MQNRKTVTAEFSFNLRLMYFQSAGMITVMCVLIRTEVPDIVTSARRVTSETRPLRPVQVRMTKLPLSLGPIYIQRLRLILLSLGNQFVSLSGAMSQ